MRLKDDLDTAARMRRRTAELRDGPGAPGRLPRLSDNLPPAIWQQVRNAQASDGAVSGGEGRDSVAGGPGLDPIVSGQPTFDVDRQFLTEREGARAQMYVPRDKQKRVIGSSGPTIGVGVDFGAKDVKYLRDLGLAPDLINRLAPYLGVRGEAAGKFVDQHPLTLDAQELEALNSAVQDKELRKLAARFDKASKVGPFEKLPRGAQTAIASLYFQYGTGDPAKSTPNYWRQITTGDWNGAHGNLINFHDQHRSRRELEAALLMQDIRAGRLR